MARAKVDKSVRRAILDARHMIQEAEKLDCNEAETRRRIERIFENLMGYDVFKHLSMLFYPIQYEFDSCFYVFF